MTPVKTSIMTAHEVLQEMARESLSQSLAEPKIFGWKAAPPCRRRTFAFLVCPPPSPTCAFQSESEA
eukprot:3859277-Pyramimonas_sp.AAC.1